MGVLSRKMYTKDDFSGKEKFEDFEFRALTCVLAF
jgi:hypothetical protein